MIHYGKRKKGGRKEGSWQVYRCIASATYWHRQLRKTLLRMGGGVFGKSYATPSVCTSAQTSSFAFLSPLLFLDCSSAFQHHGPPLLASLIFIYFCQRSSRQRLVCCCDKPRELLSSPVMCVSEICKRAIISYPLICLVSILSYPEWVQFELGHVNDSLCGFTGASTKQDESSKDCSFNLRESFLHAARQKWKTRRDHVSANCNDLLSVEEAITVSALTLTTLTTVKRVPWKQRL